MSQTYFARNLSLRQALLLLLSALLIACQSKSAPTTGAPPPPPPPNVTVQGVHSARLDLYATYPARTRGARVVEVRARVEGILLKRFYNEGDIVARGDTMFQIDPRPFKVVLQRAQAQLASAQAKLRRAQREWHRVLGLVDANAISTRERDQALSTLGLGQANVSMARALVAQARIDLGYTKVNAPLPGATSLEAYNEGSLVRPGNLLTTITQLDPMQVRFSIPEDNAALRREAMQAMTTEGAKGTRAARVILPNETRYAHKGVVDFTNSSVDPRTGTVQARAMFPNPNGGLIPGQFLRVSVRTRTLPKAIVVPEQAVAAGANGSVIYVVDNHDVARARPVKLGVIARRGQVITSGLKNGDRIIIGGIVKVADGAKVTPETAGHEKDRAA